ncbi:phosphoribosylglycinamide formyltransferase [Nitrospira defluvii]|nr:phosphoribosylglycinamide formyltransferase [Nitrospira defluvii]
MILGVLASGRGSNVQALIDAIERGVLSARIAVVISNKEDASVLVRAKKKGIPTFFCDPKSVDSRASYDGLLCETLQKHQVELLILAGYMRLLTKVLVAPYRERIINIHPSLLPAFPGLQAHRQAIDYGVKVSGCTVHFVDEKMDHGPVIAQASVPVKQDDTASSLAARILQEEHRLFPKVIQWYAEKRLRIEGRRVLLVPEAVK